MLERVSNSEVGQQAAFATEALKETVQAQTKSLGSHIKTCFSEFKAL